MPQLTRLRFCNVGPQRARMEDLILSLEDIDTGYATHSAIWLRNGGGKTTLISLILWLLCPDKTMPDKNQIEDYVQIDDHSVLVAEWQMDKPPSLWTRKPERYITGVFCEWRTTASQEGKKLQKFFFSARVLDDEPRFSLEALPLYTIKQDKYERKTLASFRQEWRELDNLYPQAEVEYTETFIAWRDILERIGVDPELFKYQVHMNTREGGAAEPFLFKENERFVNFFLEMMGESATGNEIAETIKTFRHELLILHQQIEPEHILLQRLLQQLTILCQVADERNLLHNQVVLIQKDMNKASQAINQCITTLEEKRNNYKQTESQSRIEQQRYKEDAVERRQRALLLRYMATSKQIAMVQEDLDSLESDVQEKKRQVIIWQSALPLRTVLRAQEKIKILEQQIEDRLQEHKPSLLKLQESARNYAAALLYKIAQLKSEEQDFANQSKNQKLKAQDYQNQAQTKLIAATKCNDQARAYLQEANAFIAVSNKLKDLSILQTNENWCDAYQRIQQEISDQEKYQHSLLTLIKEQEGIQEGIRGIYYTLKENIATQKSLIQQEERILKPGYDLRQQIAEDTIIQQYLETTEINFDFLTPQAVEMLQNKQTSIEESIARLRLSIIEQDTIIQYISNYGLLPPSQAITQVWEILKQGQIRAWSGWQYLTESIAEADRRAWIQKLPGLAFGIVVADESWLQAQEVLKTTSFYLETPIILFSKRDLQIDTSFKGWTIGPSSDAYFNSKAGNDELLRRQIRRTEQQEQYDLLDTENRTLKKSLQRLQNTFSNYSTSWLKHHETLLEDAKTQYDTYQKQHRDSEKELGYCHSQISLYLSEQTEHNKVIQLTKKNLIVLEAHKDQLSIDYNAILDKEKDQSNLADTYRFEAKNLLKQANECENFIEELATKEKRTAAEAGIKENDYTKIDYLNNEVITPIYGDIQSLQTQYTIRYKEYHQNIGANELTVLHDNEKNVEIQAYQQFKKKLQKPILEEEVRDTLKSVQDFDLIEDLLQKAIEEKQNAENNQKSKKEQLNNTQQEQRNIKQKLGMQTIQINELQQNMPLDPDKCIQQAEEDEKIASASEQSSQQYKSIEKDAQQQIKDIGSQVQNLEGLQNQIYTLATGYASLFDLIKKTNINVESGLSEEVTSLQGQDLIFNQEDINLMLRDRGTQLKEIQKQKENLDGQGKQASQKILDELNEVNREFKEVTLARRLLEYKQNAFETNCQDLLSQISQRQLWVQTQREKMLQYKENLVQQLMALADSGISYLNSATKHSKLPASLPRFEQRPFLRINTVTPLSKEERTSKIVDLLDSLVKDGTIPKGIELLQQAVRRLSSSITVHILFPDPSNLHYVLPTEMMKESGGERLTSMVLLYCTLLRMRAAYRTKPTGQSSSLILDNPIGVASRALFLELQREVAQAMNIQLIYTTAIKDFEALSVFPNIIRIRNDQRDRRTGNHLLMHDANSEGLSAMRIMHSLTRDFSKEHQEQ